MEDETGPRDAALIRREVEREDRALTEQYRRSEHFLDNLERNKQAAAMYAESGLLPDGYDTPQKVFVGMSYGAEIGLAPMTALRVLYVVHGQPSMSAQAMTALCKARAGVRFEYEELEDPDGARVTIIRPLPDDEEETFTAEFTMEDAERIEYYDGDKSEWKKLAAKHNYRNYPQTMCRWRAISEACRVVCPDVVLGIGHTPEEIAPNLDVDPTTGAPPGGRRVIETDVEDAYRGPRRSTDEKMEDKAAEQGARVAADLGASADEEEQDEPTPEQYADSEPEPADEAPKQVEEEPESEPEYPTLDEFLDENDLDREGRVQTKDQDTRIPAEYAIVRYSPSWWRPVVDGRVRTDVHHYREPCILWCRKHKAALMYDDAEEPGPDWDPEEADIELPDVEQEDDEHPDPEASEPSGDPSAETEPSTDAETEAESPPTEATSETSEDGDEEGLEWERDITDMETPEVREEMLRIVQKVPGWEFPGFLVRFATQTFLDRLEAGDDSLPTKNNWVDPRQLGEEDTRKLALKLRVAAERKIVDGEEPEFEIKAPR